MLREYQIEPVNKAYGLLMNYHLCYLEGEMRTGKTMMSLTLADRLKAQSVLFVTPKKVVTSKAVYEDYKIGKFTFELTVINYEQVQKLEKRFDVVIADEAHKFGAFPKPSQRTQYLREMVGEAYLILMSGTPHPETMSQIYHQFWLSKYTPFQEPKFYAWAKNYVTPKQKKVQNGLFVADYSNAIAEKILADCGHLFVKITQKDAGFKVHEVEEHVIEIPVSDDIYKLVKYLIKNRMFTFKNGDEIICDTPGKLWGKIHQLFSGTVKTEKGTHLLDTSKIDYIKKTYVTDRVVIFYKFIAEGDALREAFKNEYTEISTEFNAGTKRIFISQIQSGSTGINLSQADLILFYNIDYSYVQYAQARARSQAFERTEKAKVHWLFAKNGIERKIYDVVQKKKDYNLKYFKKDFFVN